MTMELHIEGIPVKIWHVPYTFGPFPLTDIIIQLKELGMKNKVLECKIDAMSLIYDQPYQMFYVVRSKMRPEEIDANEYADFLITVAKNKQKQPLEVR
jgi:hypothetical protein